MVDVEAVALSEFLQRPDRRTLNAPGPFPGGILRELSQVLVTVRGAGQRGQMLDGLRPRVAPSEALSLGSLALEAQQKEKKKVRYI